LQKKDLSPQQEVNMIRKQQSFFKETRKETKKWWVEEQHCYGGSLDYRKCARPVDSKSLMHTVFKAELGYGIWFTRSQRSIEKLLKESAYRYDIKIKAFSIQKNHIHVLTYHGKTGNHVEAKENFANFLRYFAAEMGRKYKKIFQQFGGSSGISLWAHRPFTRIVKWGTKSLNAVVNYIKKNTLEALGVIEYSPRRHKLNQFLQTWVKPLQKLQI
jgi:REP element-mobilizing transposase RayT